MIPTARYSNAMLVTVLFGLAAFTISCDDKTNSQNPVNQVDDPIRLVDDSSNVLDRSEAKIIVEGDKLTVLAGETEFHESIYCTKSYQSSEEDSLVKRIDTVYVPEKQYRWSVRGDTLKLTEPDTFLTPIDNIPFVEQLQLVHLTGTGLYGLFLPLRVDRIALGTVRASSPDSSYFGHPQDLTSPQLARTIEILENLQLIKYETRLIVSWADYTISMFLLYRKDLQADYAKIDDRTFTITGRLSKEVVKLRLLRSEPGAPLMGDIEFSSDDSSHPTAVEYLKPTSCPNGAAWYTDFIRANISQ